jgi:8-oxo-dGTP pyrophosphatase MutT (NUDIX family)
MSGPAPATPEPSATAVLLRASGSGLEFLLLQRPSGSWVFPGGRVESEDLGGGATEPVEVARRAAVRETREEAGLDLAADTLRLISRWITPEIAPKRFDTWFFVAAVSEHERVAVDGVEIHAHRWLEPERALELHGRGELRLPPPTFVTVSWLLGHASASAALDALCARPVLTFRPRICPATGGAWMLYPGDAGYETGEPDRAGPRHRLWTGPGGLRYERD